MSKQECVYHYFDSYVSAMFPCGHAFPVCTECFVEYRGHMETFSFTCAKCGNKSMMSRLEFV